MARLNFHPAAGFGNELPEGWHIVPMNRPQGPGTPLVPSVQATMPGRVIRRGRLAELMPGGFTVPQNPLRLALGGLRDLMPGGFSVPQNPVDTGMGGMGCSSCGSSGTANYTLNGLGAPPTWAQIANAGGHQGISAQMRAAIRAKQAAMAHGGPWRT